MTLIHIPDLVQKSPLYAAIAVCITLIVAIVLNAFLRSLIKVPRQLNTRRGRTYVSVMRNTISALIFGTALYIIFQLLDINLEPLLASVGIAGLTIGIGARSLVEDLIAGFFILSSDSIAVGDYVLIANTFEGTVEDVGFRSIKLRALNGAINIIPNGQAKQVMNYSRGRAVLLIDLPIKTGQNIDDVIKVLSTIITELKKRDENMFHIASDSEVYGVENISAGGIITVRVKLSTTHSNRLPLEKEFRYEVLKVFEKKNIQFA